MIVAIHQPNFFPWLGYFDKISRSDVFVFLDDVQYPRMGRGTWSNRVKVIVSGEPKWITAPILRKHGQDWTYTAITFDDSQKWRAKTCRTLERSYGKCPHFGDIFPVIDHLITNGPKDLVTFNIQAVLVLLDLLRIPSDTIVRSGTLETRGEATDRLISIVHAVSGDAYLAGGGAPGYQEDARFAEAGIDLIYQDFAHPTYEQTNTESFVAGLSVIDALMNVGVEGVRELLGLNRIHQTGGEACNRGEARP